MFIEEYRTLESHLNQNMKDNGVMIDCFQEYRQVNELNPSLPKKIAGAVIIEVTNESIIEMMKTVYKKFICSDSIYEMRHSKGLLSRIRKKVKGGLWYDRIYEDLAFEVLRMLYEKSFKTFVESKSSGI